MNTCTRVNLMSNRRKITIFCGNKINVLLLGCGGNAGRNFTKCLHMMSQCGKIIGTDYNQWYLAASRVDVKELLLPEPEQKKVSRLQALISKYDIRFIHAQPDPEVEFLCRNAKAFDSCLVRLHPEILERARNKAWCQRAWVDALGLKFDVKPFLAVDDLLFDNLRGADKKVWVRMNVGAGSRGALPVTRFQEAVAWVKFWVNNHNMKPDDFILAPYLPGPEYAVQTLWWNGKLIHAQARERVIHFFATLVPSGQSSTSAVARTIHDIAITRRALDAINILVRDCGNNEPHGIFCVDLRRSMHNELIPTEINYGRFFTTMDFFAELRMNSPVTLLQLHLGLGQTVNCMIDALPSGHYWIRGLDQNPILI